MPFIEARHLSKIYGTHIDAAMRMIEEGLPKDQIQARTNCVVALRNFSLTIERGSLCVVMGLSGSGKSTFVRHLNRLIEPTSGEVVVAGTDITGLGPSELLEFRRKSVSMVFQSFALFPHKTVLDNVAYGLRVSGETKKLATDEALKWIEAVGLKGYQNQYPDVLSGGMKQRVGLARALASNTDIILMDEAFSALDPLIRAEMQDQLLQLQRELNKTIVFITHDIDEAVRLGSTITILREGEHVQTGSSNDILHSPSDAYVKRFVSRYRSRK